MGTSDGTQPEAGPSRPELSLVRAGRPLKSKSKPSTSNLDDEGEAKAKGDKGDTNQNQHKKVARSKPVPQPIKAFEDAATGEEETVHEVYERIAPHFSQTRHKVSPLIRPNPSTCVLD